MIQGCVWRGNTWSHEVVLVVYERVLDVDSLFGSSLCNRVDGSWFVVGMITSVFQKEKFYWNDSQPIFLVLRDYWRLRANCTVTKVSWMNCPLRPTRQNESLFRYLIPYFRSLNKGKVSSNGSNHRGRPPMSPLTGSLPCDCQEESVAGNHLRQTTRTGGRCP